MTFEQFESILLSIGEVEPIPGAAKYGSDDIYVKLWRCYGNDKVCQVHQLYEAIMKCMECDLEIARLKGQNEVLRQISNQLKETIDELAGRRDGGAGDS